MLAQPQTRRARRSVKLPVCRARGGTLPGVDLDDTAALLGYGMSPQVLCSVVRIATHSRVYVSPSRLDDALAYARVLLEQPQCTVVTPGPRHFLIFEDLCRAAAVTGSLVQDAWFAALAVESGCEWITTDGDFARFPGLRLRRPF